MSVGVADLNRDGKMDVVIINRPDRTRCRFLWAMAMARCSPRSPTQRRKDAKKLGIADLDNDGILDIVVPSLKRPPEAAPARLRCSSAKATARSSPRSSYPPDEEDAVDTAIADLNNDGLLDLVFPNITSGNISVLLQQAHQSRAAQSRIARTSSKADALFDERVHFAAGLLHAGGDPTLQIRFHFGGQIGAFRGDVAVLARVGLQIIEFTQGRAIKSGSRERMNL